MYLEVYPDIIFFLNFIIDFILLLLLKKVNRKAGSFKRMLGAAAAGAAITVLVSIFPRMNIVIRFLILNVAAAVLMILIAFGRMKRMEFIKQVISLYLITYFAGGLINSIYYYTDFREKLIYVGNKFIFSNHSGKIIALILVLMLPLTLLLLWLKHSLNSERKELYKVELFFDDRRVDAFGLMDSGNCLYDPIFKKPVMVVENSLIKDLLPSGTYLEFEAARKFMEQAGPDQRPPDLSNEHVLRFRFIPYQSIGKMQGMMLGLVLDKVLIHTEKETVCNEKVTAAICDNHLSAKDDYHVLLHKELI